MLRLRDLVRTVIVTACHHQSDGMFKAISNATVSMVSKSLAKLREHTIRAEEI